MLESTKSTIKAGSPDACHLVVAADWGFALSAHLRGHGHQATIVDLFSRRFHPGPGGSDGAIRAVGALDQFGRPVHWAEAPFAPATGGRSGHDPVRQRHNGGWL